MENKELEGLKIECAIYRHRLSEEIDRGIRLQKELELTARELESLKTSDKSHKK
ncbi:hypothetical protein ACWEWU_14860 [Staphylococcus xylosus]|uniref:hypothetical protein n=1 Tax=Staphylococcus xylosus TaxID=1288 RepID=UPI0015FC6250|nr:hypothetical protein [Staphylococcus xylosus]